ncbi:MAG: hypothetical protein NTW32_09105 [Chloroflexi bacterium]|nr:hypothetical protein [Chloroflexota bacterium]
MRKIFFALIMFAIFLVACAPASPSLERNLVGTWQDSQGFQIEFRGSGKGFIPGVEGKIPDSDFTYQIIDEQHVLMSAQGQQVTIDLHVDGDKLTWKDTIGEVQYTRVKK